MNFDLSDEQKMLAEQARSLLAEHSPYDRLRALIDGGAEWDEPLWRQLAAMGFLAVKLPEVHGGLDLTELDLGVISEELGRANAAVPFFSSIVLCADAIRLAGSTEQQSKWLPKLASGEAIGTLAYAEGPGRTTSPAIRVEGGRIFGEKTPVADAGIANLAVVACANGLALVELNQSSVARTRLESFDQLRPHYSLRFEEAAAEVMPGRLELASLFDRAAVQAAFEAVGGAEACLHMARDYALDRRIFGRPLASYQAIKHKLADLAVAVEIARSNAFYAGWSAGEAPDELAAAAASARLTAISAFEQAARENVQIHGGIGYTFEANCHFYSTLR